jgi:hypothetical protein
MSYSTPEIIRITKDNFNEVKRLQKEMLKIINKYNLLHGENSRYIVYTIYDDSMMDFDINRFPTLNLSRLYIKNLNHIEKYGKWFSSSLLSSS